MAEQHTAPRTAAALAALQEAETRYRAAHGTAAITEAHQAVTRAETAVLDAVEAELPALLAEVHRLRRIESAARAVLASMDDVYGAGGRYATTVGGQALDSLMEAVGE